MTDDQAIEYVSQLPDKLLFQALVMRGQCQVRKMASGEHKVTVRLRVGPRPQPVKREAGGPRLRGADIDLRPWKSRA